MLLGNEIEKEYRLHRVHITSYNPQNIGTNSYDVTLQSILKVYTDPQLDVRKENPTTNIIIPEEGYVLQPGNLYLGCTVEQIGSDYYVPMYEGRSSLARLGLQSHISAGFGDIGFKSSWTLEITTIGKPLRIYPYMRIGQVYFMKVDEEARDADQLYQGKYVMQLLPQQSKSYLDEF